MTMSLPKYELYEQGSQVRRSTKSVKDQIVEGYGKRRYKDDFIKFLVYAQASCDEATSQINMINDIHFNNAELNHLIEQYEILGKKINKFIHYVESDWKSKR